MIEILFENKDVIAANKPEGVAVIPERRRHGESLAEVLSVERNERLYVVHRIDKETSGVVVFARNAEAHRRLNHQFATRTVEKVYVALVHGVITTDRGQIDKPLRPFGSGRIAVDAAHGKKCVTEFRVLRRLPTFTLVETRPRTGRRHQIRAHLNSLGHPIVGDRLYGHKALQSNWPRLMLHAYGLTIHLASTGDLTIEAPIPNTFTRILQMAAGI